MPIEILLFVINDHVDNGNGVNFRLEEFDMNTIQLGIRSEA